MLRLNGQRVGLGELRILNSDTWETDDGRWGMSKVVLEARVQVDSALLKQLGDAAEFVESYVATWVRMHDEWDERRKEELEAHEAHCAKLREQFELACKEAEAAGRPMPPEPDYPYYSAPQQPRAIASKIVLKALEKAYVNAVLAPLPEGGLADGEEPPAPDAFVAAFCGNVRGTPSVSVFKTGVTLTLRLERELDVDGWEDLANRIGTACLAYDAQASLMPPAGAADDEDEGPVAGYIAPLDLRRSVLAGMLGAYWPETVAEQLSELVLDGSRDDSDRVRLLDRALDIGRSTLKSDDTDLELNDDGDVIVLPGFATKADLEAPPAPEEDEAPQQSLPIEDGEQPAPTEPPEEEFTPRPAVPGSLGQAWEVLCSHFNEDDTPCALSAFSVTLLLPGGGDTSDVRVRLELLVALGVATMDQGDHGAEFRAAPGEPAA